MDDFRRQVLDILDTYTSHGIDTEKYGMLEALVSGYERSIENRIKDRLEKEFNDRVKIAAFDFLVGGAKLDEFLRGRNMGEDDAS